MFVLTRVLQDDKEYPETYPDITTIVSGWNTSLTIQAPYDDEEDGEGVDRLVIGPREVNTMNALEEVRILINDFLQK